MVSQRMDSCKLRKGLLVVWFLGAGCGAAEPVVPPEVQTAPDPRLAGCEPGGNIAIGLARTPSFCPQGSALAPCLSRDTLGGITLDLRLLVGPAPQHYAIAARLLDPVGWDLVGPDISSFNVNAGPSGFTNGRVNFSLTPHTSAKETDLLIKVTGSDCISYVQPIVPIP